MKNSIPCFFYGRFSPGGNQTHQSIEGQLTVCRKYAKENNLNIVAEYCDEHITGRNDQRPKFQKMLNDIKTKGGCKVVLVYALDRFGRNKAESAVNRLFLKKHGVTLVSATQKTSKNVDGTTNLDGILLESVYEGLAEYYSEELSQKVKRGQNESFEKNKYLGGTVPLGYKIVNKFFEIEESTAHIVRRIFNEYYDGLTVDKIIEGLKADGIKNSFNRDFSKHGIMNILSNEKYIGNYVYGGRRHDGVIPKIISPVLFEQARLRMEKNKRNPGSSKAKEPYLLSGKLFCGYCGSKMLGESGTSKTGAKHHYYKCYKQKRRQPCHKKVVVKDVLEDIVVKETINHLFKDELLHEIAHTVYLYNKETIENNEELIYLTKELTRVQKSIDNIMKAIEQGIITSSTKSRLEELEAERDEIDALITQEELKQSILVDENDIYEYFKEFADGDVDNPRYKERLLNTFVNKVFLYDDKMVILYNFTGNGNKIDVDLKELEEALEGSYINPDAPPRGRYTNPAYYIVKGLIALVVKIPQKKD